MGCLNSCRRRVLRISGFTAIQRRSRRSRHDFKAPSDVAERLVIVIDPMLATGHTAVAALDRMKENGVTDIRLVCLLAAPEGIDVVRSHHPDVPIWTAAIDERLNDREPSDPASATPEIGSTTK